MQRLQEEAEKWLYFLNRHKQRVTLRTPAPRPLPPRVKNKREGVFRVPGGFLGCQEGGSGDRGTFSPIQGAEGLEGGAELAVAEGGAEPLLEETLQAQDGLHVRLVLGGGN